MKPRLANRFGSTRVSRVQFGVAPNCVGALGQTFDRTRNQKRRVAPVSGGTPETARETRVLPTAIENCLQA
jgi:hypothetical protein